MNEQQYTELCEACDKLLPVSCTAVERMSIAWLQVLNEHPSNLKNYESVFEGDNSSLSAKLQVWAWHLLQLLKATVQRRHPAGPQKNKEAVDVIIVSHMLNIAHAGEPEDFYFGNIPDELKKRGLKTLVVLRNHTSAAAHQLELKWGTDSAPRLILPNLLSLADELTLRWRLFLERRQLKESARDAVSEFQKQVMKTAATKALAPDSISTLRFYLQIKRIAEQSGATAIAVTYEGHAWERLAFSAGRSASPSIHCIGYQHAILFPRQHAIKQHLGREYNPDVILTSGEVTRDVLHAAAGLRSVRVVSVGTHRQDKSSMSLADKIRNTSSPACLVIPDGTMEECLTILSVVLEAAGQAPDIRFIVRMHPVMPFSSVVQVDRRLQRLPENIELSKQSLAADFDECRWAIYRGSGAAIRAVAAGLRPFYFARPDELHIDPIYPLRVWRTVINTPAGLIAGIRKDLLRDICALEEEWIGAQVFCKKYFMPVDVDVFCNEFSGRVSF
ncbi:MAG: hypothetical protein Q8K97_09420 [Pseudohongiella sp.]|nr:hypothetical protein [Pseudohongiella sp.]